MYATKRRQRNFKRVREPTKPGSVTNPSKRHRERLNGELETVASLLPYDQTVISRLDKLSVLRLAVSFLQAKTHFQVSLQKHFLPHPYYGGTYGPVGYHQIPQAPSSPADTVYATEENLLKALGGFILILNENGEIYYTTENVETYLGFHQSDILHQSIFDMIHSEDREELRQQLLWNYTPQASSSQDHDSFHFERSASARFRCLLDNTCGFLRIDIRGKLVALQGLPNCFLTSRPNPSVPVLGLLSVCTPFVPPPNIDGPDTEPFLKTKHALDFSLFSMDSKAKLLLEMDDKALPTSFFQMVHWEDAPCLGEAHKEVIKSGASGLLVYRIISKITKKTYWLQSSCRLFYKNGKPESIGSTHRLLTEVEGWSLLEKRASLSAKLLSFDDSLLQSPKLLQSTAALTPSGGAPTVSKGAAGAKSGSTKGPRARGSAGGCASIRDPAARVQSAAVRNAAAALAANSGMFGVRRSDPLAFTGLPYTPQSSKQMIQTPVAPTSWLATNYGTYQYLATPDCYGFSQSSQYANYCNPSAGSPNINSCYKVPKQPEGSANGRFYSTQIVPSSYPAQNFADSTMYAGGTEWGYGKFSAGGASQVIPSGPKGIVGYSKDLRKCGVIGDNNNFSISAVTDTLLAE